jgi:peptide/nickel transport system substrate-binding protein
MRSKSKLILLIAALVLTLVLAACDAGTVQQAQNAAQEIAPTLQAAAEEMAPTVQAAVEEIAPTVQAAVETVTSTAEPKTLTIATGTDVENMNIHLVTSSPSYTVLEHIHETLFEMSTEGELQPLLAESIEPGDEPQTFIIKLRQGISFTDGTPFDATAVKANLDYVLDAENAAPFRFLINRIEEVVVVDDYTVQINLSSDFAPLAAHLSHGALAMVSPAALDQGADFLASNAIGTGPYVLSNWARDEAVTLQRNPDYWGEPANIDTVVFKVVKEDGARLIEVEAGTADIAVRVPPAEAERLAANPNINIEVTPGLRTIYIFFNVTQEPFDDVRVRQAVNYAVDVESIVRDLFENAALESRAPFAPPIFGYAAQTPYSRDPVKARELLDEAGLPEGSTVVLYHPTGRYIQDALVADAVRSQLREVGLNVELRTLEWPQYVPFVRAEAPDNEVQFAMLGWGTPTMDADYALYALFHSSEIPPGFNGAFYQNPEVDALLDAARTNPDPAAREAAYAEAIEIIWNDAPWLFLYSEVQLTAIRTNVEGFVVHPNERMIATGADKR